MYNLNFSMLVRDENEELCKSISSVISDMKADGTIEAMKQKYIAGSFPIIEGM